MCLFMNSILKDEQGFTLLETLLSLLISSFVIMLLTGGLLNVVAIRDTLVNNAQKSGNTNQITGDRQVEWHIFLNQFENYLQGSYEPEVSSNHIHVKEENSNEKGYQNVYYRIDGSTSNFSRRESNGYHRMLTNIQKIHFTHEENGWLEAETLFANGQTFSGKIWIESWLERVDEDEMEKEKTFEPVSEEEEGDQDEEEKNDRK